MKFKRILVITGGDMVNRGVESFLIKWVQCAPKGSYRFDLYLPGTIKSQTVADQLITEGTRLLLAGDIASFNKISKYLRIINQLTVIIKLNMYDVIHINTGNITIIAMAIFAAKQCGQEKKCIVHSHNGSIELGFFKGLIYHFLRMFIVHHAGLIAACSQTAAQNILDEKVIDRAIIINNCIDTEKYRFLPGSRVECRKALGIGQELVVGHVGHFCKQKNHSFLIDAFMSAYKKNCNARLLMIGNGELESTIEDKITEYGLKDAVIHIKSTDEMQKYLCAMDVFVLPSLFEGLPIVGVEAQTNGLPCIFSDTITREVGLCDNVDFLPITSPDLWAERMLERGMEKQNRERAWLTVKEKGYDISHMKEQLIQLYGDKVY